MAEHDEDVQQAEPQDGGAAEAESAREESASPLDDALAKIAALEAEVAEHKNDTARCRADFFNYRTRVERDRAKDRILAAESACDALIPVLDNLDRTLAAVEDKESGIFKGVSMVQKQFLAAMKGLGLEVIDTSDKFDPKMHEAVATVDVDDDASDGVIVEVLNKGYRLGEKILRAAMVKVARVSKPE